MKNCFTLGLVLAFVGVCAVGLLESKDSGKPATTDEYAVYAVALEEVVGGYSYVLMNMTSIGGKPEAIDRALSFPIEDADLLTTDLVSDFKAKNQQPSVLAKSFPNDIRVTLIAERERDAMFAGCIGEIKCGWKTFYDKYPGAPGITTVSRVGFNQKRNMALVYVGNARDWEVGQGMYLLLEKTDGEWKVVSRTKGWLS
jgi:hypothetical protein